MVEREFLASALRRGRFQTSPVFTVTVSGERWIFQRRRDAAAFAVTAEEDRLLSREELARSLGGRRG
jgi:hypothetical protein